MKIRTNKLTGFRMARLWIGNIDDTASDDELKELLRKYGFPEPTEVERLLGDGSRPAAILTFEQVAPEGLRLLAPRVHDLFWRNRKLTVQVMRDSFA